MRNINLITFLLILLFFSGCEKDDKDFSIEPRGEFYMKYEKSILVRQDQIDFYDFSSHLLYLKESNSFLGDIVSGEFSVFVGNDKIYSGKFHPGFSCTWPIGVYIHTMPTFYGDYILSISYNNSPVFEEGYVEDPRNDIRIVQVLKKHNQYRNGLVCEILSVKKIRNNNVEVLLKLTNMDVSGIYYLDPEKMGLNLFHYFTNGLYLRDKGNKQFTQNIAAEYPQPWDSYEKEWLSLLESKKSVFLLIEYENFDNLHMGEYTASFMFPGLGSQVNKKDIQQEHGRIWLGQLHLEKQIVIE